jgi:hypothetical protein
MLFVRAVRKIHTRHIHAGQEELFEHFLALAGWTNRGNNLGFTGHKFSRIRQP